MTARKNCYYEHMDNCSVCARIKAIKAGDNPSFVTELQNSYVVIGDHQFYRGYTVVISKIHAEELHELGKEQRDGFLQEMADVAEAMFKAFKPAKLNYELLGNTDKHMHWHLFPRYADDPNPTGPTWVTLKEIRKAESTRPSPELLHKIKTKLLREL